MREIVIVVVAVAAADLAGQVRAWLVIWQLSRALAWPDLRRELSRISDRVGALDRGRVLTCEAAELEELAGELSRLAIELRGLALRRRRIERQKKGI
ncbi:MAG TPA: hypothetical protein VKB47_17990 [Terracidiphilus sp.]|nr:hypothetical protein [Terracidiphilus sp.]